MRDLVLLKIGGSVCTEKDKGKFKVRENAVKRIAREILEARKENGFRLIVANGAGPFGHVNVTDYDINHGLKSPRDFEGFCRTISDCHYLNWKVAEIMRREGLDTIAYPTTSVVIQSNKKISTFFMDVIKRMWDSNPGIIPVMNGDMVADIGLRGSVASGDAVLGHLAERFNPRLMVFVVDVDGIFTADPRKDRKARLIDYVTKQNFHEIRAGISGSFNVDVTGGMLGKVEKLLGLRNRTIIVNGNVPGRVRDAILGEDVCGTIIG
jgi:isopentenyl phosphate kinase